MEPLLERESALRQLASAAAELGRMVVVSGEAGIGKTSLVRTFEANLPAGVRVLRGACDDLMTARALGPFRDAAAGTGGPLEAALAGCGDGVFEAALAELTGMRQTVLVIEDAHWADDATLDLLGYLGRRIADLPAVIVVTTRDTRWRLTGCQMHRVALEPLSDRAVQTLSAGTGWDSAALHALTGGNPFFVTEALAAAPGEVPATVSDAVVSRFRRLSVACQQALAQLSVVPGVISLELAETLPEVAFDAVREAEDGGILRVCDDGVVFRHELARRAIENEVPVLCRRRLHRAVISALRGQIQPDPVLLTHHAASAGDVETVIEFAPRAGREAAAAGSHRQALVCFEAVAKHADRLPLAERAGALNDYAWELHNAHRFIDALEVCERAVALYVRIGDPAALSQARVRLSRLQYLAGNTDQAQIVARQAVEQYEPTACGMTNLGTVLALCGDPGASRTLAWAHDLAVQAGRTDLVELCLNYQSLAQPGLSADERITLLRQSLDLALRHGHHEHAARGYTNLAELLYLQGRFGELRICVRDGLIFTHDRGLHSHAYNLSVHQNLLRMRTGDWPDFQPLVDTGEDPGMLGVYAEPHYGRLLARRGSPQAGPLLAQAWQQAQHQQALIGLAYTATALMEWAWLADRPDYAAELLEQWRPHAERPGAEPVWAELLRYAARAGVAVSSFDGCPRPWASGLDGDWQAAAVAWATIGDPYEQALELAGSGEIEPTVQALRILDDLGATAVARLVRRKLKTLGLRTIPRGPKATTKAHPAGLTSRQADVLNLLADGLTNAEIASHLIVSVRTVDHHVSTILGKLGVKSRREARAFARERHLATG